MRQSACSENPYALSLLINKDGCNESKALLISVESMRVLLPAQDFSLGPARSKIIFGVLSHIINPLLTNLVRSKWLDIGLVLCL